MEITVESLKLKVKNHMNWDDPKVELWFKTKNPMLGMTSPNRLIQVGRIEKLAQIIDDLIEGNFP